VKAGLSQGHLPLLLAAAAAACTSPPPPASHGAPTAARVPQVPVTARPERAGFTLAGEAAQGGLLRGQAPSATVALHLDGKAVAFDREQRFILGLDRDQGPSAILVAALAGGGMVERPIAVARGAWAIERVGVARRPAATAEFLRRREGELARIAAARAVDSGSEGWRQRFAWPARGRISGAFGAQRIYLGEPGAFHSGVDVAAGAGATVAAPADGVVVLAGPPSFSLEGNLVIIDHGMGLNSAFLHLAGSHVTVGQKVRQGEPIGTVGATGRASGPHLHWGMKWRDARIDPASLAEPMDARP
jgi:murein DD-endopeptidase MepM/ murein hydrolase activator NlpD